jgi:sulfatase modifying factor 1
VIPWITIPAGNYTVGGEGRVENPRRTIELRSFRIAAYETTNREFQEFVDLTGYVTVAERRKNAMVFEPGLKEFRWLQDRTANWRYPNGVTRGGIEDRLEHPVTTICYKDAIAYCHWKGVRLPTLDEWEVAARGRTITDHFFGTDQKKILNYANVWHARDHLKPDATDGYVTTSPVGKFRPNPFGLYDVYGNVFEFCSGQLARFKGKSVNHSRGGSWWCSKNSCCFFNSVDIGQVDKLASFSNQGFRVVALR